MTPEAPPRCVRARPVDNRALKRDAMAESHRAFISLILEHDLVLKGLQLFEIML
jgi:hypothetical protein